jgi:hypothetical protein
LALKSTSIFRMVAARPPREPIAIQVIALRAERFVDGAAYTMRAPPRGGD